MNRSLFPFAVCFFFLDIFPLLYMTNLSPVKIKELISLEARNKNLLSGDKLFFLPWRNWSEKKSGDRK